VNKQRPKNLNLLTIRFPLPAIVSILHRISGIILFLSLPFMLWALETSLHSEEQFNALKDRLATPCFKFITWACLSAFLFHVVTGIRHLLMDLDIGVSLQGGRKSAALSLLAAFILVILAGVYVW